MNNTIGSTIAKMVALTGGAIAGAMLANWCDKWIVERIHARSEYDKNRYAQGLAPVSPKSSKDEH
ncbi:MAG TPA: hypothetical protein VL461_08130 [Dictyobacter sp.]|jgi:hypothetical protein|nr:hypothetical protein [Dictyobacter sp.]